MAPFQTTDKPRHFWRGLLFSGSGVLFCGWLIACSCLGAGWLWCFCECHGDLLDVLGGGGEQALHLYAPQTSEPGIAMAVQLFGIGKGALHGFLAALVDGLALGGEPMRIGSVARLLPDMARNRALGLGIGGARGQKRAGLAQRW